MRKLNLIISFLTILLALTLILSCKGKTKSDSSNASKKFVLITMDSIDEHWLSVKKGSEDKVKELGNIELIFRAPAGKTDPNEQTRMAEDAINQKADAILLAPSDIAALSPVAAKIKEANIPLILIDSAISTEDYDAFLSTDNEAAGELAGETFAKLVNGKGKIGIVHAQPAASTAIARGKGFETKIKENFLPHHLLPTQRRIGRPCSILSSSFSVLPRPSTVQTRARSSDFCAHLLYLSSNRPQVPQGTRLLLP